MEPSARTFIPVASPSIGEKEKAYVLDCLETGWVSSGGEYIARFERAFAEYCGVRHAVACCNGTVALHLALLAAGVGPGHEVIVPTLTFVATANAVTYCGATPVFVDSNPSDWNLDPDQVAAGITSSTRAIIPVHIYGYPADMAAIRSIVEGGEIAVIEDAAEAHGATCGGRTAGGLGDAATFSFFGKKIITTGEGGMVTTDDAEFADKCRRLRGQGMDPDRRYWFDRVGYNYRMTNIEAALGLAQLEDVDGKIQRRAEIAQWYRNLLADVPGIRWQTERAGNRHADWMFTIVLGDEVRQSRQQVMDRLADDRIESRPVFYPMHTLPPYRHLARPEGYPVAETLAERGISLPTWTGLGQDDVGRICETLRRAVAK